MHAFRRFIANPRAGQRPFVEAACVSWLTMLTTILAGVAIAEWSNGVTVDLEFIYLGIIVMAMPLAAIAFFVYLPIVGGALALSPATRRVHAALLGLSASPIALACFVIGGYLMFGRRQTLIAELSRIAGLPLATLLPVPVSLASGGAVFGATVARSHDESS